ncbi:hypothetical protein ACFOOM_21910 [Streptomyces echinoruber]|uniref:Uncharacterized protein n=1 Tax=Streptomyces echinoruber TaxID=68898 RepID=A0A918V9D0_9ACTN|nr:hypothetical protein [Streptomyces echinoruber]GGZ81591.1 hypothetical protein GCM10010389_19210 [Streptomyces echinoruber]
MDSSADLALWRDLLTLQEPPYREPTDEELLHLQDQVADAARELAHAISTREAAYRASGQQPPGGIVLAPDWQLAYLYALHAIDGATRRLAEQAARTAGATGASYAHLGTTWGITKQAARLRWPGAVRRPGNADGEADPLELRLGGGVAEIIPLPDGGGFIWEATGADGTSGQAEEPYGTRTEAAAHAGAFLTRHATPDAYDHDTAHADCFQPHFGPDSHTDCDGNPL